MSVTPKCNADDEAVDVDVTNGQFVEFEVSFKGAQPLFAVVDDSKRVILSAHDQPVSPGLYRTKWPAKPSSVKSGDAVEAALGVQFIAATQYTCKITCKATDGSVVRVAKDCTYTGTDAADTFHTSLTLRIV